VKEYGDNYFDFKFSLQDILNRPVDLLEDQAIKNPCFKKELFKKKVTDYNDL
jgi:predicted nucleotidyltransferase